MRSASRPHLLLLQGLLLAPLSACGWVDGLFPSKPSCSTSEVEPVPVTLDIDGWIATVSGSPLGLTEQVNNQGVTGSLTYDACLADSDWDAQRGSYDHAGSESGGLSLSLSGLTISGSGRPLMTVENLDRDTFRYLDGASDGDETSRVMAVNGVEAPALNLVFAITDTSGAAFHGDEAPMTFPMTDITGYPHTFALNESGGSVLMQLTVLSQTSP